MIYEITPELRRKAEAMAKARTDFHRGRGTPEKHKREQSYIGRYETDLIGALGEVMVGDAFNLPVYGVSENWKEIPADVGDNVQVRTSLHPRSELLMYPDDPDDQVFIFVRITGDEAELVGWVWGHEGKHPRYWTRLPSWRNFCYRVTDLHPMDMIGGAV